MGSDIDFGLLRDIITAAIAILVYWIKRSTDNGLDEIKTSLTNINNNISTVTVNVHPAYPERITPDVKLEEIEDESIGQ
jgi:hypothetical protein